MKKYPQFCFRGHDTAVTGRYAKGYCKVCAKEDSARNYADPEKRARKLALCRTYQKANREKSREKVRRWKANNPESAKASQKRTDDKRKEKRKFTDAARHSSPAGRAAKRRVNAKRLTTLAGRIENSLRCRVRCALSGTAKSANTLALIGGSVETLRHHLERQFALGMTWENYGRKGRTRFEGWEIDHILPCASFDLTDPEQQRKCFHYTNLQPLWARDNMSKGARILRTDESS